MSDGLDTVEELQVASEFMRSMRGRYILSQALHYGVKALKDVWPEVMQEKSNIADMEYLQSTLFNFPDFVFEEQVTKNREPVVFDRVPVAPTEG